MKNGRLRRPFFIIFEPEDMLAEQQSRIRDVSCLNNGFA
jgi:hypothetical protein